MQRTVNTIDEEAFSMWFAYIHCWATEDFVVQKQEFFSNVLYVLNVQVTKGQAYS
jgi:hypothetical protein